MAKQSSTNRKGDSTRRGEKTATQSRQGGLHGQVIEPLKANKNQRTTTKKSATSTRKTSTSDSDSSVKKNKQTAGKETVSNKATSRKSTSKQNMSISVKKKAASKRSKPNKKVKLTDKLFFWRKEDDKAPYTGIRKRHSIPLVGVRHVGASALGSAETDLSRFKFIWFIALVALMLLVSRAAWLQVINAQFYIDKGNELTTSVRTQKAYRGMITDRNNLPLAISAPLSSVSFSPYDYARTYYSLKKEAAKYPDDPERQQYYTDRLQKLDLARLSTVSGVSLDRLQKAVAIDDNVDLNDKEAVKAALPSGAGSHFLPLLNKVTPEIADAVMALDFVAVYEKQEFRRYYPQSQPNAQLLGFMGYNANDTESSYEGRAGIELKYEQRLAGEDGQVLVLKDRQQNSIDEVEQIKPVIPGEDVRLSIDSRLQYLMYKELEKVGRIQEARWATGMVVDVNSGEVLALSTWPSFNSNNLNEMTGNNQRNRAILDVFEPGSVVKPFTVAAALKSGKYTDRSLIDTSPGSIRVRGYTIRDHEDLGIINMATLLQKSSNVAATKIALSLPPDSISNLQKQFGFGSKTALSLPGEQAGIVPTPKEKETARRATLSYGYGQQVTLAQIAQAYSTLGAGGIRHPLTLLKTEGPVPGDRIIDAKNAMSIVKMMETVTQEGGTAVAAAIDGYSVAGKTGTSRRINPEGGYYNDQYRTVFAGLAPASNPRLVAVVLVEDPQKDHYAGLVAAPVFKSVMQEALRLYNVPLDQPLTVQ